MEILYQFQIDISYSSVNIRFVNTIQHYFKTSYGMLGGKAVVQASWEKAICFTSISDGYWLIQRQ